MIKPKYSWQAALPMIKWTIMILISFQSAFLVSLPVLAGEENWFTVGVNDDSVSLASGFRKPDRQIAYEFGLTLNPLYNDVNDSKCPDTNSYIAARDVNTCSVGMDALWFPGANRIFFVGAGLYLINRKTIVHSRVTGEEYGEDAKLNCEVPWSTGIILNPGGRKTFGLGYHSLRGFNLRFSLDF